MCWICPDSLLDPERPSFGILVLEGVLLRDVVVAHTTCGELVGPGELLRPLDQFGLRAPTPFEVEWKSLQPVRVAVLDREFGDVLVLWPPLVNAFLDRAVERSHSLALHVAIHCLRRVDLSLLVLFAHLADRFGRASSATAPTWLPARRKVPTRSAPTDSAVLAGLTSGADAPESDLKLAA